MSVKLFPDETSFSYDERKIFGLYQKLMVSWNNRKAADFAPLFAVNGSLVGYDGTQVIGREEIEIDTTRIFRDHLTPSYVAIIREIRFLTQDAGLLRATAGMIPYGKTELDPTLCAVQLLLAVRRDTLWYIAHFQNTPAQFHGRPLEADALMSELKQVL